MLLNFREVTDLARPRVLVLTGYGINCDEETKHAFDVSGAASEIVHVNDLIDRRKTLRDYDMLAFPGGFSYGDDTGSGRALANRIKHNLWNELQEFVEGEKLVLGICNGFQVMANLGLVPALEGTYGAPQVALTHNTTARYECRWVNLKVESRKCVFTEGIDFLHVPVAHGEGNFYAEERVLESLRKGDQIVVKYVKPDGSPANKEFPFNPNGSLEDIAGICDGSGRIFGLMPHPERNLAFTNRDDWTRLKERLIQEGKPLPVEGEGLKVFRNAVNYFK